MAQRTRRPNAGNRLQSLLAEQIPLDDAEAELFAERDDDEDFDLEAEEERLRQERLAREADASENGEERDEGDDEDDSNDDESDGEHDDSNFSDTSDDSESDRDELPQDAGEKELQKVQRKQTAEKRKIERNKIFRIKKRPAPDQERPKEPKKRRVFTSADILMKEGRTRERKSALRNKHHLIEQMREAEQRRARYVPPKRTKAPKLTQEERLEEAKKTELRNLSSLNKFVEIEEERKIQQRLAMISRRPKLTQFVRFHSAQYMQPPKLIETIDKDVEIKEENDDENREERLAEERALEERAKQEVQALREPKPKPEEPKEGENKEAGLDAAKENTKAEESTNVDESKETDSEVRANDEANQGNRDDKNKPEFAVESKEEIRPDDDVKTEGKANSEFVKVEESEVPEKIEEADPVYGPPHLKTYNFLTLHDFQDIHINKYSIRSIVLGPIASTHIQPPQKRMCPFTGKEARYVDPKTNVAYSGLESSKLLKMVAENKLGWSKEMGGVFTLRNAPQRHAKGVPEGFV